MGRSTVVLAVIAVVGGFAMPAHALEPGPDGFVATGLFVRRVAGEVEYSVLHEVKTRPSGRTADALVDANIGKRFLLTPAKALPCEPFRARLKTGLLRNGLSEAKAAMLIAACPVHGTIRPRARVLLAYRPENQTTTLEIEGLGTTQLSGLADMKAVWRVWLGATDDPAEKRALVSRM